MSRFVPVDRDTAYLLPPSVDEWLPNDHLARFVVEVIEQLDLRELTGQYAGRGSAAHHPAVLLGLLIYGYANGVHSSRKIERATYDSVAFRYVAANTHPDHDTLATFRRRFLTAVESLFVQVLLLAREMKLLKLGHIALDGTKIDANASKHKALSWGYANRIEVQLREEVQQLLTLAENSDRAAVPDGMDVPAEIARREDRLSAIAQAKAKIEQRAAERHAVEQQEFEVKTAKRQAQRKAGKKPRGKDPEPPAAGPKVRSRLLALKRESHHLPVLERFAADSPSPQTSDPVEQMAHCLSTQSGRALYKLRKQTVEPVFGIIKRVMGWRQMSMRGLAKAQGEWSLVTMAWNIKRLHVLRAA
ncbi:transposase [Pseudomonas sp. 1-7]|nr:transposase [Pseudomonas sp. 1-7]